MLLFFSSYCDDANYCCCCYCCCYIFHTSFLLPIVFADSSYTATAITFVSTLSSIVNAISKSCSFGSLTIDYRQRTSYSRSLMWYRRGMEGGGSWRISFIHKKISTYSISHTEEFFDNELKFTYGNIFCNVNIAYWWHGRVFFYV